MPRALFEKTGSAVYISHLDTMRLMMRAFQRAGLKLTHSQGYNPRPNLSIALPMSLGTESRCELLDFDLDGQNLSPEEIKIRLNGGLVAGLKILSVYEGGGKLKNLALMESVLTLEYDKGIPAGAREAIAGLFAGEQVIVTKKGKSGTVDQNLIPMIRRMEYRPVSAHELEIRCLHCCQNPTLNPVQIGAAVEKYLPDFYPDFIRICRVELYDPEENIFR